MGGLTQYAHLGLCDLLASADGRECEDDYDYDCDYDDDDDDDDDVCMWNIVIFHCRYI